MCSHVSCLEEAGCMGDQAQREDYCPPGKISQTEKISDPFILHHDEYLNAQPSMNHGVLWSMQEIHKLEADLQAMNSEEEESMVEEPQV